MLFVSNITLDLVKEAIKDKEEFRIFERDGFIVVDYMISKADTFNHEDPTLQSVLRELRGIAFSADGSKVISRPYHKFFNINEKPETLLAELDFSKPHTVLNKEDGSMIRVIPVDDGKSFRLGTRAGITSVSMQAERWWAKQENYHRYLRLFVECEKNDLSPIFEYVGPNNRIVLSYEKENMILTGLRNRVTGQYVLYSNMVSVAELYYVPVVQPVLNDYDMLTDDITHIVAKLQGLEGVVVRFEDGVMVKCKADEYVDKHRAVSQLKNEKDVLKLIFTNNLDDVLPILSEDVRKQVESYRTKVVDSSEEFEKRLHEKYVAICNSIDNELMQEYNGDDTPNDREVRKQFALAIQENERYKRDSKFLFTLLSNGSVDIPKYISEKASCQGNVDAMRHIIGEHKLWKLDIDEDE